MESVVEYFICHKISSTDVNCKTLSELQQLLLEH